MATNAKDIPLYSVTDDLNEIACTVSFDHYGNISLEDAYKFEKKLTNETVSNLIDKNGVACIPSYPSGRGATGGFGFSEILKLLIDSKDYIGMLIACIKLSRNIFQLPGSSLRRLKKQSLTLELSIRSGDKFDINDPFESVSNRLTSVKDMAEQEAIRLRNKYPAYSIGQIVTLHLPRNCFEVKYRLHGEQCNTLFDKKIVHAIKGLYLVQGLHLNISISRLGLIKHSAEILVSRDGQGWSIISKKPRVFYTYISTKVAGGYFPQYNKMDNSSFENIVAEKAPKVFGEDS